MRRVLKTVALGALGMLAAGCSGLPPAEQVKVAPPAGVSLPYEARVLLYVAEADMAKMLSIEITNFSSLETQVKEGEAIAIGARDTLAQVFRTVETNRPAVKPQLVVKVIGKAKFTRTDGRLRVGCGFEMLTADGIPLGTYSSRFEPQNSLDYQSDLPVAYRLCLKGAAEEMLKSPALARQAAARFPEPNAAAVTAYLRSLGLTGR